MVRKPQNHNEIKIIRNGLWLDFTEKEKREICSVDDGLSAGNKTLSMTPPHYFTHAKLTCTFSRTLGPSKSATHAHAQRAKRAYNNNQNRGEFYRTYRARCQSVETGVGLHGLACHTY